MNKHPIQNTTRKIHLNYCSTQHRPQAYCFSFGCQMIYKWNEIFYVFVLEGTAATIFLSSIAYNKSFRSLYCYTFLASTQKKHMDINQEHSI